MYKINVLDEEASGDFAFEVDASSLMELFRGAGIATTMAMIDPEKIEGEKIIEFEIKAKDLEMLFYEFLSELIYIKDVELVLFKDFNIKIKENEGYQLKCKGQASPLNWDNQELKTDVKAATMHKLEIKEERGKWYCKAILDL